MPFAVTAPLRRELERALPDRPFAVELWDGTRVEATRGGGPTFSVRSPRAVAHALRAPGQLGIGRAYVSGELEVDDIDAVITLLEEWSPPSLDLRTQARLALAALRACGLLRPPVPPRAELRPQGTRRSRERDARAVRHHYDLPPEFFALFLDRSMTYSCAIFERPAPEGHRRWDPPATESQATESQLSPQLSAGRGEANPTAGEQTPPEETPPEETPPEETPPEGDALERAQERKLDLVCRKLGLAEGERVLDVGCGWGSFPIWAASRYGVEAVGITLSEPQARVARERAAEAGVGDRVDIRVADYRDLAGERYDAIASIGMVEHVGSERIDAYAERLADLLPAGGRLLNHGITRLRHTDPKAGPFSERYVFPDADPLHLSRVMAALERAGFVTEHVEGFQSHYAETLRHWARRLDTNLDEAIRLAGPERVRVWRLYLRAARNGFETGFTSIYQVLARRA